MPIPPVVNSRKNKTACGVMRDELDEQDMYLDEAIIAHALGDNARFYAVMKQAKQRGAEVMNTLGRFRNGEYETAFDALGVNGKREKGG